MSLRSKLFAVMVFAVTFNGSPALSASSEDIIRKATEFSQRIDGSELGMIIIGQYSRLSELVTIHVGHFKTENRNSPLLNMAVDPQGRRIGVNLPPEQLMNFASQSLAASRQIMDKSREVADEFFLLDASDPEFSAEAEQLRLAFFALIDYLESPVYGGEGSAWDRNSLNYPHNLILKVQASVNDAINHYVMQDIARVREFLARETRYPEENIRLQGALDQLERQLRNVRLDSNELFRQYQTAIATGNFSSIAQMIQFEGAEAFFANRISKIDMAIMTVQKYIEINAANIEGMNRVIADMNNSEFIRDNPELRMTMPDLILQQTPEATLMALQMARVAAQEAMDQVVALDPNSIDYIADIERINREYFERLERYTPNVFRTGHILPHDFADQMVFKANQAIIEQAIHYNDQMERIRVAMIDPEDGADPGQLSDLEQMLADLNALLAGLLEQAIEAENQYRDAVENNDPDLIDPETETGPSGDGTADIPAAIQQAQDGSGHPASGVTGPAALAANIAGEPRGRSRLCPGDPSGAFPGEEDAPPAEEPPPAEEEPPPADEPPADEPPADEPPTDGLTPEELEELERAAEEARRAAEEAAEAARLAEEALAAEEAALAAEEAAEQMAGIAHNALLNALHHLNEPDTKIADAIAAAQVAAEDARTMADEARVTADEARTAADEARATADEARLAAELIADPTERLAALANANELAAQANALEAYASTHETNADALNTQADTLAAQVEAAETAANVLAQLPDDPDVLTLAAAAALESAEAIAAILPHLNHLDPAIDATNRARVEADTAQTMRETAERAREDALRAAEAARAAAAALGVGGGGHTPPPPAAGGTPTPNWWTPAPPAPAPGTHRTPAGATPAPAPTRTQTPAPPPPTDNQPRTRNRIF